jgi:outer membrane protein OmpA-like peptidoglycan-associated protein
MCILKFTPNKEATMFKYLNKSVLLIALTAGIAGVVLGCATSQPPPPGPPPGLMGQVLKFDINTTSEEDIANALEADGRVVISGGILFEFDSAKIAPKAIELVSRIADVMKQHPNLNVAVVGYTDNTGNFNYNIKLSQRRAYAIVDQLVRDGIAANRLAGVGVGPLNPIASNDTAEGRAQNRRVELVLIR